MAAEAPEREAKVVTPVSFYQDRPFGVAGNMVKKDFTTKPATADDAHDDVVTPEDTDRDTDTPDDTAPDEDATTSEDDAADDDAPADTTPQVDDSVEYEASQKSDKPIEDVDAPALNGSSDDETLEL